MLFDGSRTDLEARLPKRQLELRVAGDADRFRAALNPTCSADYSWNAGASGSSCRR
jgi:hypothetical protein